MRRRRGLETWASRQRREARMQGPAVRAVGCVACDQQLPFRSLAARLRGSEVVVEFGTYSKRQPELHSPGGDRGFIADGHASLTHNSPCNRSVNKGSAGNKDAHKAAVAVMSAVCCVGLAHTNSIAGLSLALVARCEETAQGAWIGSRGLRHEGAESEFLEESPSARRRYSARHVGRRLISSQSQPTLSAYPNCDLQREGEGGGGNDLRRLYLSP
ncbi:uncharacterized protein M421DRAFT_91600 [Didymella exigua CBS 183.55]|uniref:Uncharacterized protein n=1 Tax=Didymella exigua CBS 183.55 TaxID=1150837 RepID=A0A6A5RU14_9PLEO|nr:uncharacterized protein M421DRAFT_91600 [Didymella exigua CBS 183.55]KAF1929806.1 hypothetical protein M421DRAFT_91600 [Didymella exigua CBS 183.55]